jgi:hypothetical protein
MSEVLTAGYRARHRGASIVGFNAANEALGTWSTPSSDAIVESSDEFENRFEVRLANSSSRRGRASSLIQRRYAWRGYAASPLTGNSPSRVTLSACVEDETVATITAGIDADEGLYVAQCYADEVAALRDEGRRLCEFTKLAVDESVRGHAVLGAIFHVACTYAIEVHRCTDVLIEVNPRHVRFYQRMLGFEQAAGERLDSVVNAPAVLLRLDLAHCAREMARLGGRRKFDGERSFYPFFLSPSQSPAIVSRLQRC